MITKSFFTIFLFFAICCNSFASDTDKLFKRYYDLRVAKSELVPQIGKHLDLKYLKALDKYMKLFVVWENAILAHKKFRKKFLKKLRKEEFVQNLCASILIEESLREEIVNDCQHPYFSFCPSEIAHFEKLMIILGKTLFAESKPIYCQEIF